MDSRTKFGLFDRHQLHLVPKTSMDMVRDVANVITMRGDDDPFYIFDVGRVLRLYQEWRSALPRVQPFYAVKCNNDPVLLSTLAALGCGFDCASKKEIDLILDNPGFPVPAEKIIFANPCKTRNFIKHASKRGVNLMTFDNEEEVFKVKALCPDARLVLRINVSDETAVCQLSNKFGCDPVLAAPKLLELCAAEGVPVVGISFHVGSGCRDPSAFHKAIKYSRDLFNYGDRLGHNMTVLDLGGGYPGSDDGPLQFRQIVNVINDALTLYFPEDQGVVNIIAEPGRFFACSPSTLCCHIISKTKVPANRITQSDADTGNDGFMYYINDGVYGSFNCILYDHVNPTGKPLFTEISGQEHWSSVWGPTCDGLDLIEPKVLLPEAPEGDWMVYENMGAYTNAAGSEFNGFERPSTIYFADSREWLSLLSGCQLPLTTLKTMGILSWLPAEEDSSGDEETASMVSFSSSEGGPAPGFISGSNSGSGNESD